MSHGRPRPVCWYVRRRPSGALRRAISLPVLLTALALLLLAWWSSAEGDAQLLVWTDVRGGGTIAVSIDSQPVGGLSAFYSRGEPTCRDPRGALLVRLAPGPHHLLATDDVGRRWRSSVDLPRVGCRRLRLAAVGASIDAETASADSGGAEPR